MDSLFGSDTSKADLAPLDHLMDITDFEFGLFKTLIHQNFGIYLTEAKRSLLVRRLQRVIRTGKFKCFKDYYDYLVNNPTDASFTELVNRITTNYTFFNREPDHFDFYLNTALPEICSRLSSAHSNDLRVWCAAASTGEEPYMLAMLQMEFFGSRYYAWDAGLLATDISERALTHAKAGVYHRDEFKNMPPHLLKKYFKTHGPDHFQVDPKVKKEVTYRRFNLVNKTYPFKKRFDIIFCRNVMIYFNTETKTQVANMLHNCLNPGGYLFLGHSESITNQETPFRYVKPAVYRRVI